MISVEIRGSSATVTMKPFKPRVVEAIRTIHGRRWDAKSKTWAIPTSPMVTFQRSVEKLVRTGELVTVNGKEWAGSVETRGAMAADRAAEVEAESQANPFMALWQVLPARLRQPVYDALFGVLAPGAGGDVELLVLLDQAHEAQANRAVRGRAS